MKRKKLFATALALLLLLAGCTAGEQAAQVSGDTSETPTDAVSPEAVDPEPPEEPFVSPFENGEFIIGGVTYRAGDPLQIFADNGWYPEDTEVFDNLDFTALSADIDPLSWFIFLLHDDYPDANLCLYLVIDEANPDTPILDLSANHILLFPWDSGVDWSVGGYLDDSFTPQDIMNAFPGCQVDDEDWRLEITLSENPFFLQDPNFSYMAFQYDPREDCYAFVSVAFQE